MTDIDADPALEADWRIYTEDWDPSYGVPATFTLDDADEAVLAEGSPAIVQPAPAPLRPLCFVDGTRRAELSLWAEDPTTGERVPGLAGAYAVGATLVRPHLGASFAGVRVGRLAIWGGGRTGRLQAPTGHVWSSATVTSTDPADLLVHLQERMRVAEGALALDAAASGWDVVLDGPLNRLRSIDDLVTGYVKTHMRRILPPAEHAAVPSLPVGARTALYALGPDRYTCYVRVGHPGPGGSPWGGIARLDFPAVAGLPAIVERADRLAPALPAYAGVPHRDPRAPVNLTPVRNLEAHLARMLGRRDLATRAARDAVITRSGP